MRTGGGGGYGDPLEREPKAVLQDLQEGKITEPVAADIYGVIINKEKWIVDAEATRRQRRKVKQSRLYCKIRRKKDEEFIEDRRVVRVPAGLISSLGVCAKDVIELMGKAVIPLRVWTLEDESYSESEIGLDKIAMRML